MGHDHAVSCASWICHLGSLACRALWVSLLHCFPHIAASQAGALAWWAEECGGWQKSELAGAAAVPCANWLRPDWALGSAGRSATWLQQDFQVLSCGSVPAVDWFAILVSLVGHAGMQWAATRSTLALVAGWSKHHLLRLWPGTGQI